MIRLIMLALCAVGLISCARDTAPEVDPSLREIARDRYVAQRFGVWLDWRPDRPKMFDAPQWVELARKAGAHYVTVPALNAAGAPTFGANDPNAADPGAAHDPLRELAAALAETGLDLHLSFDSSYLSTGAWNRQSRGRFESLIAAALEQYRPVAGVWIGAPTETASDRRWLEKLVGRVHRAWPDLLVGQEGGVAHVAGVDMWRSGLDNNTDDDFHDPALDEAADGEPAIREFRRPARLRNGETSVERARLILRDMIRAVGRDANFQIEITPGADGQISNADRFTLLEIGDWFETYGESVYGTRGGPTRPGDWGVTTHKNSTIYLHYLGGAGGRLGLDRAVGEIGEVYQFSSGATLDCVPREGIYEIPVPPWLPHPVSGVIALEIVVPDERLP